MYLLAARSGRVDVVDFLVNKTESDINATDEHGCSSLHHACWDGQIDVVIVLLQAGVATDLEDIRGRQAVDLSKTRYVYLSIYLSNHLTTM
jgi:ankyrin repeat protein